MGTDLLQCAPMETLYCCLTGTPGREHHDLLSHSVTLSWHWAKKSLPYPNNAERPSRKRQVSIWKSLVWLVQVSNPRLRTRTRDLLILRSPKTGVMCGADGICCVCINCHMSKPRNMLSITFGMRNSWTMLSITCGMEYGKCWVYVVSPWATHGKYWV